MEAWSLGAEIRQRIGQAFRPTSVVVHLESEPEPMPPAVSLSEIGAYLNVSRQRAQQLSRQPGFPKPLGKTANGPIYAFSDVERYQTTREMKKGRDKKGNVFCPAQ